MKCKICKKEDTKRNGQWQIIEPHHIIPEWFKIKTERVELCRGCHTEIHAFYHKEALKIAFKLDKRFFHKCFKRFKNGKRNTNKDK